MSDFPSSKFQRGKIFAKTGLKLGTNYAKRYVKESISRGKTQTKPSEESRQELSRFHSDNAQEVFKEFTKLRGTALKIAQSMSMDQGWLPEEFAEVMSQAQYSVPPINRALVRSLVKKELGKYPEQLFASFNTEALAAASIGQVHRAGLKDGRNVAVKIQYPHVRDTIESDLQLAKLLFKRFMRGANIDVYIDEIRDRLMEETDYQIEGEHIEAFAKRLGSDRFVLPRWVEEYSTRKLLTMSFVEGRHMNEFLQTNPSQELRDHFGQLLWDFFHRQIEQQGPIHADTHPGNFLFRDDRRLGVIDFGCVKSFPHEFYYNYLKLLPTHAEGDDEKIRALYKKLEILVDNPSNPEKEEQFYRFCKNYGDAYSLPYQDDHFDFGDPTFKKLINKYAREFPIMNEPRGSRHFLYGTRTHLGLYSLLIKLGARVDTSESQRVVYELLDEPDSVGVPQEV